MGKQAFVNTCYLQSFMKTNTCPRGKKKLDCITSLDIDLQYLKQEISLKKIFGSSQILTILTQLSDEIPLYSLSLHAGKGCSV